MKMTDFDDSDFSGDNKDFINCCIEIYKINGNNGVIPFHLYLIEMLPILLKTKCFKLDWNSIIIS